MPYYMNMWRVCMLFIQIFFCFQASTALCIFMSTHVNSWIKVAARQNTIWIRFGNRRAVRRWRAEAGMALAAIGECTQWGGVADCSGSRTIIFCLELWYSVEMQSNRCSCQHREQYVSKRNYEISVDIVILWRRFIIVDENYKDGQLDLLFPFLK